MKIERLLFWRNLALSLFGVGLVGFFSVHSTEFEKPLGYVFWAFGFFGAGIGFIIQFYRCEQCRERFFIKENVVNILSSKCLNCGHEKV